MRKFKTPVSMFMTKQDIQEGNLIERMVDLGYTINFNRLNDLETLFVRTNINNEDVKFLEYPTQDDSLTNDHIEFANVDLFVALSAMSKGEMPYIGEVLKYLDGIRSPLTFKSFTSNQGIFKCFEDDSHRDYSYFRKATREEIIEHFKPKPMGNKFEPKNGEIVEFSWNGIEWAKGEYIGEVKGIGYAVLRKGSYSSAEAALAVIQFIRKYSEPTKVTRIEIAKLLGVDEFEIID